MSRPSLTLNALLNQAIATATPTWIDTHCEVRTFNTMRRATVAALPDGTLSYCLALVADSDVPADYEPGSYVGLICELIGPDGQLLAHEAVWGIREPDTYSDAEIQPYLGCLAEHAACLMREATDISAIRRSLQHRLELIAHTLEALS